MTLTIQPRIARLPGRSLIMLDGADALRFLDGLVSGDLDPVAEGRARYGALLTPQGKILHDLIVAPADPAAGAERLLVECATPLAGDLVKRLTLYKLRAKVTIRPATELVVAVAFDSGAATALGVDDAPGSVQATGGDVAEGGVLQLTDPRRAGLGVRLWGRDQAVADRAAAAGLASAEAADWDLWRIEARVPEGPADLPPEQGLALEHDLDRLNGVAFDKGCYVGQEVTTRSKFRGQVRKRLFVVDTADGARLPPPGTPVMAGERAAGDLRSSVGGTGIALLRIDRTDEAAAGSGPALTADGITLSARPRGDD